MATICPGGNDPNDGDRNPEEQKHIGPIPPDVKETIKKKRRLTEFGRQPQTVREYADIIKDVLRCEKDAKQQRDEETATEKRSTTNLDQLQNIWQGVLRLMQVRSDVLSSISAILSFLDNEDEDFKDLSVDEIRACLKKLQEYIEKKNEEADTHQKKITDFYTTDK